MSTIAVIGIGAMGGGMARALLDSTVSKCVIGLDQSEALTNAFYQEAFAVGKAAPSPESCLSSRPPTSLEEAISEDVEFVVIVLQNEIQCQEVCFGTPKVVVSCTSATLLNLLSPGSCVILCSTVTPQWSKTAAEQFAHQNILMVDCPISGGPARARAGDLTLLASCGVDGNDDAAGLERAQPILQALGRRNDIHIIPGGAGQGSMVKMVHQLLAGVHICVAAEALALAAKAGLNVQQMYDIVNGAAGASWMFTDRGKRMIDDTDEVKSQLQIFVKDLDIVYQESKRLQSPIPIASAALQQFIAGQSLGLSQKDDSKIVQVYENVTKVPLRLAKENVVAKQVETVTAAKIEGDEVGDLWKMEDGHAEEIVEVGSEPRHKIVLSNEYVRALRVSFPPKDTTLAHRHAKDSLYFFLVDNGLDVINHVKGTEPACDCMTFGEVRFGEHVKQPLVHRITNISDREMLCIDAEVLSQPPVTSLIPLVSEKHELIKTRDKCRVYKLSLEPGESVTVSYPFFHLSVVLLPSTISKEVAGPIRWSETSAVGDISWKEPTHEVIKMNIGQTTFVEFIAEWR